MKTIFAALAILAGGVAVFAQTNTFPGSGNVGIGTTTPLAKLDVSGVLRLDNGTAQSNYFATLAARYDSSHPFSLSVENNSSGNPYEVLGVYSPGGGGYYNLGLGLNGNVGIGTTAPWRGQLNVNGANKSLASTLGQLSITTTDSLGADIGGSIIFGSVSDTAGTVWPIGNIAARRETALNNNIAGYMQFATADSGGGLAERVRITSTGNVGIGTTSPQSGLHVFRWSDENSGGISFGGSGTYDAFLGFAYLNPPNTDMLRISRFDHGTRNNRVDFVSINAANGNVGIGTTNPSEKLSVKGRIRAQEVVVDNNNWSDYVLADDYKLQPLSDVEAQIKTNKHLPGVPSAQEVAEKGVSVGDMQAMLLAKIEELTLHQIAQEKELNALRTEVTVLKSENAQPKH
jgi:hypothetical protein